MFSAKKMKSLLLAGAALSSVLVTEAALARGPLVSNHSSGVKPPYNNLMVARQYVSSVSFRVQSMIDRCKGGEGRPEYPGQPEYPGRPGYPNNPEYPGQPPAGGGWGGWGGNPGPLLYSDAIDTAEADDAALDETSERDVVEGDQLENDQAATWALLGMGKKLFELGEKVDQATMAYNTPAFWVHWGQACHLASHLIGANQAAKVAAALPLQGLITPAEFVPNDQELHAVRQQLYCP